MVTIIDRLMLNPVQITVNGEQTTVTALEAIMLQLLQKGMEGNRRPRRVMLKYQELASQSAEKRLEITFLDDGYTRSLANWTVGQGDD
jgi:hypothetical protein